MVFTRVVALLLTIISEDSLPGISQSKNRSMRASYIMQPWSWTQKHNNFCHSKKILIQISLSKELSALLVKSIIIVTSQAKVVASVPFSNRYFQSRKKIVKSPQKRSTTKITMNCKVEHYYSNNNLIKRKFWMRCWMMNRCLRKNSRLWVRIKISRNTKIRWSSKHSKRRLTTVSNKS